MTTQPITRTACITLPRVALLQQLVEAKRIVDAKATSPILRSICLTILGGEVAIVATDLRLTVLGRVVGSAQTGDAGLSCCLDAKKLHDVVKAMPGDVTLTIEEKTTTERLEGRASKRWCEDCGEEVAIRQGYNPEFCAKKTCGATMTARGGRLVDFKIVIAVANSSTLSSGKSRFNLTTLRGADFPKMLSAAALASLTWQTVPAATLIDLIDGTLFSASLDPTREHLYACLLESKAGHLRMVSTDGHRLSRIDRDGVLALPGEADKYTGFTGILIPRDGVVELRKLCGGKGLCSVEVAIAKNVLYFRVAGQTLTTYSIVLCAAQFPPYTQVIPRDAQRSLVFDVASMAATVKRLMLASSEKTVYAVAFDFVGGKLTLRTDNPDVGNAEEDVDLQGADGDTDDFKLGISLRYLGEALEHVATSTAKLHFNGLLDPMLLHGVGDGSSRDGGDVFVIMPCRL